MTLYFPSFAIHDTLLKSELSPEEEIDESISVQLSDEYEDDFVADLLPQTTNPDTSDRWGDFGIQGATSASR